MQLTPLIAVHMTAAITALVVGPIARLELTRVEATEPESGKPIKLANFRVDAIPEGRVRNVKGSDGQLTAVRFEGVLVVTDPDQFRETLFWFTEVEDSFKENADRADQ